MHRTSKPAKRQLLFLVALAVAAAMWLAGITGVVLTGFASVIPVAQIAQAADALGVEDAQALTNSECKAALRGQLAWAAPDNDARRGWDILRAAGYHPFASEGVNAYKSGNVNYMTWRYYTNEGVFGYNAACWWDGGGWWNDNIGIG